MFDLRKNSWNILEHVCKQTAENTRKVSERRTKNQIEECRVPIDIIKEVM